MAGQPDEFRFRARHGDGDGKVVAKFNPPPAILILMESWMAVSCRVVIMRSFASRFPQCRYVSDTSRDTSKARKVSWECNE